jgi:hypothetical protein
MTILSCLGNMTILSSELLETASQLTMKVTKGNNSSNKMIYASIVEDDDATIVEDDDVTIAGDDDVTMAGDDVTMAGDDATIAQAFQEANKHRDRTDLMISTAGACKRSCLKCRGRLKVTVSKDVFWRCSWCQCTRFVGDDATIEEDDTTETMMLTAAARKQHKLCTSMIGDLMENDDGCSEQGRLRTIDESSLDRIRQKFTKTGHKRQHEYILRQEKVIKSVLCLRMDDSKGSLSLGTEERLELSRNNSDLFLRLRMNSCCRRDEWYENNLLPLHDLRLGTPLKAIKPKEPVHCVTSLIHIQTEPRKKTIMQKEDVQELEICRDMYSITEDMEADFTDEADLTGDFTQQSKTIGGLCLRLFGLNFLLRVIRSISSISMKRNVFVSEDELEVATENDFNDVTDDDFTDGMMDDDTTAGMMAADESNTHGNSTAVDSNALVRPQSLTNDDDSSGDDFNNFGSTEENEESVWNESVTSNSVEIETNDYLESDATKAVLSAPTGILKADKKKSKSKVRSAKVNGLRRSPRKQQPLGSVLVNGKRRSARHL